MYHSEIVSILRSPQRTFQVINSILQVYSTTDESHILPLLSAFRSKPNRIHPVLALAWMAAFVSDTKFEAHLEKGRWNVSLFGSVC